MRRALAAIFTLAAAALPAQGGISGYSGQALSIALLPESGFIAIGEDKGFISLWDPDTRSFVSRAQAGLGAMSAMAARPGTDEIAVVETSGFASTSLRILDCRDGGLTERFSIQLPERPLSMAYSPKGGLIGLGMGTREGFLIVNADDGELLDVPFQAGPSSFIAIGTSETSMLLYSPAGRLAYLALPSGKRISEIRTLPGLAGLRLSQDKKSLIALKDGDLVFVDASNGKLLNSHGLKDGVSFGFENEARDIVLSTRSGGLLRISGASKLPLGLPPSAPAFSSMVADEDGLYGIGIDGSAWTAPFESPLEAARIPAEAFLPLREASGALIGGEEAFLLSTSSGLFIMEVDESGEPGLFRPIVLEGGESEASTRYSVSGSAVWSVIEGEKGSVIRMSDLVSGKEARSSASNREVRDLASSESGAMAVYETREAEFISPAGIVKTRWQAIPGLQCSAWLDGERILFGKNFGGGFPTSLFLSKASTGELMPLPHEALSVFRLARAPEAGSAWGMGIVDSGAGSRTVLWRISVSPFAARELDSAGGERYDASMAVLGDGSLVHGFGGRRLNLIQADGKKVELPGAPVSVRRITAAGGTALLLLHDDSFEIRSGKELSSKGRFALAEGPVLIRLE